MSILGRSGCFSKWSCAVLMGIVSVLIAVRPLLLRPYTPTHCETDRAGACKHEERAEAPVICAGGVFVGRTWQPEISLVHLSVSPLEVAFARLTGEVCEVEYFLVCVGRAVEVKEARHCPGDPELDGKGSRGLGATWEVCAAPRQELRLLVTTIDVVFDLEIPSDSIVNGCVQVSSPGALSVLSAVRGTLSEQRDALVARKHEVGGCPTWKDRADILRRGGDFGPANGNSLVVGVCMKWFMTQYQKFAIYQAKARAAGKFEASLGSVAILAVLNQWANDRHTDAFMVLTAWATCGETSPFHSGMSAQPQYATAARIAGDLHQRREYFMGGVVGTDMCFDKSLSLFHSSGSPEHTQMRQMWDEVTMKTMHVEDFATDFADMDPSNSSWLTQASRTAKDMVGRDLPSQEEIANFVLPLILGRIWDKTPTKEEAQAMVQYKTWGALCIMGGLIDNTPLRWKILSIRKSLLEFARDSPGAKKMAVALEKPEYSAVKSLYEAQPRPMMDTALQNLMDASMFAGVVGTTDMTTKCVEYQYEFPSHVGMFRKSPTLYLWEMMRLQSAVMAGTSITREPYVVKSYLEEVRVPAGTPLAYLNAVGNRDPKVFPEPEKFDMDRPNWGQNLAWNGELHFVVERNYTGAPRHCPGHDLSVKVAEHVCRYLTRSLAPA